MIFIHSGRYGGNTLKMAGCFLWYNNGTQCEMSTEKRRVKVDADTIFSVNTATFVSFRDRFNTVCADVKD